MAGVDDRSIAAVLKDIVGNVQQMVRAEIRLAKIEARKEVDKVTRGATLLVVGGTVALLALAFVLLACVYVLSGIVAPWIAALIVALGAGGISVALLAAGVRQMRLVTVAPPKIVATIEENFQWAKTPTA